MHSHMYRRLFILPLILLLFSPVSVLFAQNIKIKINAPESVVVGEQFRVNYVIESDKEVKESVIFKKMEGLDILYGPAVSTSRSVSFKEGKRISVYTSTSVYYLRADKPGKYTLPRAEVTINGKKYKSDTFKIEAKSADDAVTDIKAFVKTIVSKNRVNLSDTLMITYRLYTTHDIHRIISSDFPSVTDFYSTNITRSRQPFAQEEIDGVKYKVVDLRRLILQSRNIGRKTIGEGQITVEYAIPTGRKVRDLWGDVYDETIRSEKTLTIDPAIISVQDLKAI